MTNKSATEPFSVLISVYAKEKAPLLDRALGSVLEHQTLHPDEVVLVEDGPLTDELYAVVEKRRSMHPNLHVISYPENRGLEYALNTGMAECRNEWIARMDSDDISMPMRFEKQMRYLADHPETDVLGCAVAEFCDYARNITSVKSTPEDVSDFIKFRSPVNHPTVVYRRSSVEKAGGYLPCKFMEDYHLWIRMHALGMKITSLQEPLYLFKMDADTQRRRGGWIYVRSEAEIQRLMRQTGLVSLPRATANICIRGGARLLPGSLRGYLYRKVMRENHIPIPEEPA